MHDTNGAELAGWESEPDPFPKALIAIGIALIIAGVVL